MKQSPHGRLAIVVALAVSLAAVACSDEPRASAEDIGEHASSEGSADHAVSEAAGEHASTEAAGEHSRAEATGEHARAEGGGEREHGDEGHGEEGEESGEYLAPDETWDTTYNGARLVLSFDRASDAFVGTVENTTTQKLCAVRVEVHLSTGTELGPTKPTDLLSGQETAVELPTAGETFEAWTAHPEASPCSTEPFTTQFIRPPPRRNGVSTWCASRTEEPGRTAPSRASLTALGAERRITRAEVCFPSTDALDTSTSPPVPY